MPRERKPFCKLEPEFVLGESPAGERFVSLRPDEQLVYIKWWAHSIRVRKIFWQNSDETLRKLCQKLGVSFRVFKRTFDELSTKQLLEKFADGTVKLRGIQEIHAQLNFRDGDNPDPDKGQDGDESGTESKQTTDNRVKSINKDNPQSPFTGKIVRLPASVSLDGKSLFGFFEIEKLCRRVGITSAQELHDLTVEAYTRLRCGPNWIEFVAKLYDVDTAKNNKSMKIPKRVAVAAIKANEAPKHASVQLVLTWIHGELDEREEGQA